MVRNNNNGYTIYEEDYNNGGNYEKFEKNIIYNNTYVLNNKSNFKRKRFISW